jgi:leukotriene-A4 hydrolase
MGANKTSESYDKETNTKTFKFSMNLPIPSYLISIVGGNIEERKVGRRSYVISEPTNLDLYVKELEDLELYVDMLEAYNTKYMWTNYKIVIMPPSFPNGFCK